MDMKALTQKGQEIYDRKYRKKYEKQHSGKFLAIDVFTEECYLGDTPDEATKTASDANSSGFFQLIRIGHTGVYRMGTLSSNADRSLI